MLAMADDFVMLSSPMLWTLQPVHIMSLFIFRWTLLVRANTCLSCVSCSSLADPQIMMSSIIVVISGMCSNMECTLLELTVFHVCGEIGISPMVC